MAKFDSNGNHLLSKRIGGISSEELFDLDVNTSGDIAITGNFWSPTIELGAGATLTNQGMSFADTFIARFDSGANHVWSKSFPDLVSSGSGNYNISLNQDKELFWSGDFKDKNSIDIGNGMNLPSGDMFLVKYNQNGTAIWGKSLGSIIEQIDGLQASTTDSQGDIWITGTLANGPGIDFGGGLINGAVFYAGFSSDGAPLASQAFPNPNNMGFPSQASSIHFDANNNLWLAGIFLGSIDFGSGSLQTTGGLENGVAIFVAKFSKELNPIWSKSYGDITSFSPFYDTVRLTTDPEGYPILGGNFEGTLNFGEKDLLGQKGTGSGYLGKLFP